MRVCILSRQIPPHSTDGIPRNRWQYARLFHKHGWEVHVITQGTPGVEEFKDGIYLHEISPEEYDIRDKVLSRLSLNDDDKYMLAYSYAVYKRVKKLNELFPIDLIDNSLWGLEGLVTKIKLPNIPMLTRVDTTSMLIDEVNSPGAKKEFTEKNQLEQFLLLNTQALVFNSWSILKETQRLYEINFEGRPYAIIHHGIQSHPRQPVSTQVQSKDKFRVLIPGRLEKRKGTELLVDLVLSELLAIDESLEIHFAGKDNSEWDGFKQERGVSYLEYIKLKWRKDIDNRIFLHGYVKDDELNELYESADCVLIPSLYESFGLTYLEAISFGKPVVALRAGAVIELFDSGKEILLASPDKPLEICDQIKKLVLDRSYGNLLVKNAQNKLTSQFTPELMASKCAAFIEEILRIKSDGTVFQVMNSLSIGDGVSGFTRDYDYLFKKNGRLTQIIGNNSSESLSHLTRQIHEFNFEERDTLLYHYCGHCEWAYYVNSMNLPRKVLFFHNITPPYFFEKNSPEFLSVSNGLRQACDLDNFDLYVALSQYSLNVLQQLVPKKLNTFIMPQLIDRGLILNRPFSEELLATLKKQHKFHIIFVGRVVPHKRQIDLIHFAHYYQTHFGKDFHVSIIGGGMQPYFKELESDIEKFKLTKNITITGKIPDEELYAYYRSADLYMSMSEHEGFGTPLAESMVFEIPIVAYGVTAIPETIGNNGCVFYDKNFEEIAALVNQLRQDADFRRSVIEKQNKQLMKYSAESVKNALREMQNRCDEAYSQRKSLLANNNKLYNEVFLNFRDPIFIKRGEWKVADARTLIHYGHEKESCLEFHSSFFEADIFIVNNSHSGKVGIYLNNKQLFVADLYGQQWVVKKYTINGNGPAVQSVKIVPLSEKNERSSGREVLVYGVRLKQPYAMDIGSLYKDSKRILPQYEPSREFS